MLRIADQGGDDGARLREIEAAVMQAQFDADELVGVARDEFVIARLREIEATHG